MLNLSRSSDRRWRRPKGVLIAGVGVTLLANGLVSAPIAAQSATSTACGDAPAGMNVIESSERVIWGTNGDDFICGNSQSNVIRGFGGADIIYGLGGNDHLYGGQGFDRLIGGSDNDHLFGGNGRDVLLGSNGNDQLTGQKSADTLIGGNGNDTLKGANGNDHIWGSSGADTLIGGNGNDTLNGGPDVDTLLGGKGDDALDGGPGDDESFGGEGTNTDTDTQDEGTDVVSPSTCTEKAAVFVTQGSANADLADPEVSGVCDGTNVVVTSNAIPDFPYTETSPGLPTATATEFTFPATPVPAATVSDVPAIGALGIAINGVPIFGATEGTGGDVNSLTDGVNECGGHNGPTGYHYHTFDTTGTNYCLFSTAEATAGPVLFGYATDGYPIYSGNFQYTSSWVLTDASLFATDTFEAHTYQAGSGDLDQCNGRTDAAGNYAYYTTDSFPYTLGCFYGEVADDAGAGGGGGGGGAGGPGGGGPGGPPPGT